MSQIILPDDWERDSLTDILEPRLTSKVVVTSSLDNATGNEVALKLDYTTNKAAGNDTGLEINQTDTLSPGNSNLIDAKVANVSQFYVRNNGDTYTRIAYSTAGYFRPSAGGISTTIADIAQTTALTNLRTAPTYTNISGDSNIFAIVPTYNQASGAGRNTDLLINRTQTAVMTGAQSLIDAQVGSVSKFNVSNVGTVTNTGGTITSVTNVNSATYNTLITDRYLSVSYTGTGAVTNIQLMTAQAVDGRIITIKDSGGNAGANTITITTQGAEKIDGQDTYTINNNYGSVTLYCYGGNWFIV